MTDLNSAVGCTNSFCSHGCCINNHGGTSYWQWNYIMLIVICILVLAVLIFVIILVCKRNSCLCFKNIPITKALEITKQDLAKNESEKPINIELTNQPSPSYIIKEESENQEFDDSESIKKYKELIKKQKPESFGIVEVIDNKSNPLNDKHYKDIPDKKHDPERGVKESENSSEIEYEVSLKQ